MHKERDVEETGSGSGPGPGSGSAEAGLAAARRMFDADKASAALGIELVELAPGRAVARMRVTASMLNGHAIGHGGYVFLLADTAFALACNSHGPATVAAGGDISFLAPVAEGDVLTACAEERVLRGRSGIYDVTVTRGGPDAHRAAEETSESTTSRPEIVAEFRGRSRTVAPR
ncbi:MAG: hydroxyphenylacetyl-CoA thioesterase PaaI [Catenulispora sp.]|nr:hydroxyphenylacetyl-CoA thioesterase PaaI [Catenulispora sp.]